MTFPQQRPLRKRLERLLTRGTAPLRAKLTASRAAKNEVSTVSDAARANDATKAQLVTQWFPPEPALQPLWVARALRRGGFDLSVVTGAPNYPTGEVAPGYQACRQRLDEIDGLAGPQDPPIRQPRCGRHRSLLQLLLPGRVRDPLLVSAT